MLQSFQSFSYFRGGGVTLKSCQTDSNIWRLLFPWLWGQLHHLMGMPTMELNLSSLKIWMNRKRRLGACNCGFVDSISGCRVWVWCSTPYSLLSPSKSVGARVTISANHFSVVFVWPRVFCLNLGILAQKQCGELARHAARSKPHLSTTKSSVVLLGYI